MSPQSTRTASLIHSELETWALPKTFSFQLRKCPLKVIQPAYIPTWERQRNSDGEWREVTPCPVSWWAVKGPEREPSSHPTGFCLCWQPCFSGNSLGTGSGKRWLWCWWESSWGGWSGSKLESHQLRQARGKKLGPLSCHETRQLDEITGPFYCSPLPDLWQSQGVFGRKETPFPIPRLRACVGWV